MSVSRTQRVRLVVVIFVAAGACGSEVDDEIVDAAAQPDEIVVEPPPGERFGDYVRIVLPDLGGAGSWAADIHDDGRIVGGSFTPGGELHAVMWTADELIDLSGELGPRAAESHALDINGGGDVLITGFDFGGIGREAFVSQHGTTIGTGLEFAYEISEDGAVLGKTWSEGDRRAALWRDGELIDIGTFGFSYVDPLRSLPDGRVFVAAGIYLSKHVFHMAHATAEPEEIVAPGGLVIEAGSAVNDLGQYAGRTAEGFFIWEDGVATPLDIPADQFFTVYSITSSGWMYLAEHWDYGNEKVLRAPDGALVVLQHPGASQAYVHRVYEDGTAVGRLCWGCEKGPVRPALWREADGGAMTDLGPYGAVMAMNARGDLVGYFLEPPTAETPRAVIWRYSPP